MLVIILPLQHIRSISAAEHLGQVTILIISIKHPSKNVPVICFFFHQLKSHSFKISVILCIFILDSFYFMVSLILIAICI